MKHNKKFKKTKIKLKGFRNKNKIIIKRKRKKGRYVL